MSDPDPARAAILAALGGVGPAPEAVPHYEGPTVVFDDPLAAFGEALAAAAGELVTWPDRAGLERFLAALDPEIPVLEGGPAVAESGAVWWVPRDEAERQRAFLAERVVLCVAREALVCDLHSAYRQIDPAAAPFGCFVAGPSKTADIEQALVVGAHGPRSLAVHLWGVASAGAGIARGR